MRNKEKEISKEIVNKRYRELCTLLGDRENKKAKMVSDMAKLDAEIKQLRETISFTEDMLPIMNEVEVQVRDDLKPKDSQEEKKDVGLQTEEQ